MVTTSVKRIRIIHRLRVAMAMAGFGLLVGAAAVLWWANHTGLPDSWRAGIEEAMSASGLHAEIASLRYLPLRGIEAGEIVIYSDSSRRRVIGRLDRLLLDIDRTKLSRGDFKIETLELSGARVTLAVDPDDPGSRTLEIDDARARMEFSGLRRLEISSASGTVGGLRLEARGLFDLYRPGVTGTAEDMERARAERRRILLGIIQALDTFDLEATAPPRLSIDARGDLELPNSLRADLNLRAADLRSREMDIRRLEVDGEVRGRTLMLHQIAIDTPGGGLNGKLEYELDDFRGRFELHSDADLPALVAQLDLPLPDRLPTLAAPPVINAHGDFHRDPEGWCFRVIGDTALTGPRFAQLGCDRLTTRFSWDGDRLLLEDLHLEDGEHRLDGRAFLTPGMLRYQFLTDLPVSFWQRAMTIEPLAGILKDFSAGDEAITRVEARGMANLEDPLDWWFKGSAAASGLSFRGVPTVRAKVSMDLCNAYLDFTAGEAEFDYRDYRLRRRHGGPDTGTVTVDRIRYDAPTRTIGIAKLRGTVWPAPVVRTFAADIADQLEAYRFHRPPTLAADGTIGIESGLPKQDFSVRFSSDSAASYEFLEKDLQLAQPRGRVRVLPDRVEIKDLDTGLFDGQIRADFVSHLGGDRQHLEGELDWTVLRLPEIARTYGFKTEPKGTITGRIDFSLLGTEVGGLDGHGHLALEEGELFDVPIFGPLSPLIAAVLGKRKAGFQEATDAFFSFAVEGGVLSTTDFLTTTPSLVFTGDGRADLPQESLDMTVRMNARGLFGVITLPLRPFYGLFQFRGRGPIDAPEWKNVMFTSPPPDQEHRLLEPPKALPVPEAPPPRVRVIELPDR
jgi:hypothetical protein